MVCFTAKLLNVYRIVTKYFLEPRLLLLCIYRMSYFNGIIINCMNNFFGLVLRNLRLRRNQYFN